MPTVFIRVRGTQKRATSEAIADFFTFYGIDATECTIKIPKWREGPDAGKPRNFCFVEFRDVLKADAALTLHGKVLDGMNFEVRAARQGNYAAAKPRTQSSAVQPHGERFKPYTREDFREE